jgi:hypothetical protein
MNPDSVLTTILQTANEILTSATVIIAVSLLLYNLTRNLRNRVARSSSIVLACVTFPYLCDTFLSLNPSAAVYESVTRLQWIGIAFVPSAMFHLSDALLETTGMPSRGRRRRIVRILYLFSATFLAAAALTDVLINPVVIGSRVSVRAGGMFGLYLIFFLVLNIVVLINLRRARQRCLTRSTRRRMGYLQLAILTPTIGLFPFSVLLNPGQEFSLSVLLTVNIANIVVIVMLIFLSYPLSFFGSNTPDRVVKTELLRFLLRGPGTGLLALATIILTNNATRILSLPSEDFMPFAVVGVVLLWQWTIALAMPRLEAALIYPGEDNEQVSHLQRISERMMTRHDMQQHLEATLSACCDLLRTSVAMVISVRDDDLEIVQAVGVASKTQDALKKQSAELIALLNTASDGHEQATFQTWQTYQAIALYNRHTGNGPLPRGLLLVETTPNQLPSDDGQWKTLYQYVEYAEQALDDMAVQTEIMAALEGLIPQISVVRRDDDIEYRQNKLVTRLPDKEEVYEQLHAALRDYWGGPGITRSRLLDLKIVENALGATGSPVKALRQVLQEAIEAHRPPGERAWASPEWKLYNIIDLRFVEGKTVKEVARRLVMSEGDLYRKQAIAIQTIADTLLDMENHALNP